MSIIAGTTVEIVKDFLSYSSADYDSRLVMINDTKRYIIVATQYEDGVSYEYKAGPTTTADYTPGTYQYQYEVYIEEDDVVTERHVVEQGIIEILPDLSSATTYDIRTHAKIVLDAIEAVIEGRATQDQMMYSIQGRQLMRMNISDLLKFRAVYLAEYKAELNTLHGTNNKIKVRFV